MGNNNNNNNNNTTTNGVGGGGPGGVSLSGSGGGGGGGGGSVGGGGSTTYYDTHNGFPVSSGSESILYDSITTISPATQSSLYSSSLGASLGMYLFVHSFMLCIESS